MMCIQGPFAEPGKVLARSNTPRKGEPGQKLTRILDHLLRILRHRPRTHYTSRCLKREIEHRREVHVKAEHPAHPADNLPVLAEERFLGGGKYFGCRGRSAHDISKSVHLAAFEVHADEKRLTHARLAIFQKLVCLRGADNISREQDYARGLQACEHVVQPW